MLESPFTEVAGLQDCCKNYILHALLRFYFSLINFLTKSLINLYKLFSFKKC